MPHLIPCTIGALMMTAVLSSCSWLKSGDAEEPNTPDARMAQHTKHLQHQGKGKVSAPGREADAAKYIASCLSDMGYAVTMQPINEGTSPKEKTKYNVLVFKPGLYSNNKSIVVGAHYASDGNGCGSAALLLETANALKDILTNHNVYLVAYADGATAAAAHAQALRGRIGTSNMMGMINLEAARGTETASQDAVQFITTPGGSSFTAVCTVPFTKSWGHVPSLMKQQALHLTGNDRPYAAMGIPTLTCRYKASISAPDTGNYVQALTDMIHHVADREFPSLEKKTKEEPQESANQEQP